MAKFIIPIFILIILVSARLKKVDAFSSFSKGAQKGLLLVWDIFPFILAILVAVELFRASGLAGMTISFLSPVFNFLGIPTEICELVFLRPFSGSGSLALLKDIFAQYGPDSYVSRAASTIMGSSETIFYVASVYFSKTSVKKLGPAIIISLLASLLGTILSCFIIKYI